MNNQSLRLVSIHSNIIKSLVRTQPIVHVCSTYLYTHDGLAKTVGCTNREPQLPRLRGALMPRCQTVTQCVGSTLFQPIPGLISCVGVTGSVATPLIARPPVTVDIGAKG